MLSQSYHATCYFEGTGLECLIEFKTLDEFSEYKKKLTNLIVDELRKGIPMDTIKSQALETLHELHREILNCCGDGEYTLKKIKKLWKEEFKTKCHIWYMLVTCLIKLRVFNDDNMYGWAILTPAKMAILIDNGMAIACSMKTKKCQVCQKDAYDKCSKCHAAFYCCGACQTADWKTHKKVCITKL